MEIYLFVVLILLSVFVKKLLAFPFKTIAIVTAACYLAISK